MCTANLRDRHQAGEAEGPGSSQHRMCLARLDPTVGITEVSWDKNGSVRAKDSISGKGDRCVAHGSMMPHEHV